MPHSSWSHDTTFPLDGLSPSRSRAFVKGHLASHDLAELYEDVALVTSELTANAVRHARTAFRLTLRSDGRTVLVAVSDDGVGARVEAAHPADAEADGGRGLLIVETLSSEWGVVPGPASTEVWACFDLPTGAR